MVTVIRVARVLLILVLALMAVSFVIGTGRPETGLVEKAVLVVLTGGCVLVAAKATSLAEHWQDRARHWSHPR